MQKGQSLIELIVAIGVFVGIVSTMTYLIVDSFASNRQGEEITRASTLLNEGYEATVSIRNQAWDSLTTGDHGIDDSSSKWEFSGTSNQDIDGKYDRVINIADIDSDTKKVTTTISWEYIKGQATQLQSVAYLSDWQGTVGGTPTPTPTPTPPPGVNTCAEYCVTQSYTTGTCRSTATLCTTNGETYESGGDQFCTGGPTADTCCCLP